MNNKLSVMRILIFFLLIFPIAAFCGENDKVNVKPNASTNEVSVDIGDQNHASMVQIIDENGSVLWTEHRKEQEFKLNLKFFPPGTYTIQVSVYDTVERQEFVIK